MSLSTNPSTVHSRILNKARTRGFRATRLQDLYGCRGWWFVDTDLT